MHLKTLLAGLSLRSATADMETEITRISYDSRTTAPGDVFVAMTGFATDGHAYIGKAVAAGAAAVVCERPPEDSSVPYVLVENSRRALAVMAANYYGHPADSMTMVAVTGTNGKTTTTYLLKAILEQAAGAKVGLIGTNQNLIGQQALPAQRTTPDAYTLQSLLARMEEAGCTHVVMEVSSHALALRRTAGLWFQAGIFTNLTRDHLDFHGTMEAYRKAKGLLFQQCQTGIFNLDDGAGRQFAQTAPCQAVTFGETQGQAQVLAREIRLYPDRVSFQVHWPQGSCPVTLPIPGRFTVYNALGVLACCLALGLPMDQAAGALAQIPGVKGRVEVVPVPAPYTVLIDYAHTPDALEKVLTAARDVTQCRLLCLFGCGGDRDRTKRPLMGGVVRELADVAVITSDNPRTEDPWAIIQDVLTGMGGPGGEVHVEPDRRQAIRWALAQGRSGDVIVLAGKGHETVQEVQGVTLPLDEREIVAEYFEKRAQCRERAGNLPAGVV